MPITFVGAGAVSGSSVAGTNITYAYHAGYTAVAGDLAILIEGGWAGVSTPCPNPPSGYTQHATANRQPTAGNYMVMTVYYNYLALNETAPTRVVPTGASWASTGATWGVCGYLLIFRGTHPSVPFDITAVGSSSAAAATFTPTAITTANGNAWALSLVMTGDDNTLGFNNAQSFIARRSGAAGNFTSFEDLSWGAATREIATPASVTQPTWSQTLNGNDSWVALSTAIRSEVDATELTTVFSVPVTLPAPTVTETQTELTTEILTTVTLPQATTSTAVNATATPVVLNAIVTLDAPTETFGQTAFPAVALTPVTLDAPTETVSVDILQSVVQTPITLPAYVIDVKNPRRWGLDAGIKPVLQIYDAASATSTTSNSLLQFASGTNWISNDLVVVIVASDNSGPGGSNALSSVTDSKGHSYTLVTHTQDPTSANNGVTITIAYATVANPGMTNTDTISVNYSTNTTSKAAIVYKVRPSKGYNYTIDSIFNPITNNQEVVASETAYINFSGFGFHQAIQIVGSGFEMAGPPWRSAPYDEYLSIFGQVDDEDITYSLNARAVIADAGTSATSIQVVGQWNRKDLPTVDSISGDYIASAIMCNDTPAFSMVQAYITINPVAV